jgi:cytochrome c-type biogenesis protein CcmH/NrfG
MKKKSAKKRANKKTNLRKEFYFLCACCATVLILLITSFNINQIISPKNILGSKTQVKSEELKALDTEILNWETFLEENPTYFEGWIRLTELKLQKGDINGAKKSYQKAFAISPNSPQVKSLGESLEI